LAKPEYKGKRSVILDSNFLFIPLKFGVDIFDELERLFEGPVNCVLPTSVPEELEKLKEGAKPNMLRQIDFALSLTSRCEKVDVIINAGETVDDSLVRLAKNLKSPVATNDAVLRRRLRAERIPVIYLRQRAYLEIEGAMQP